MPQRKKPESRSPGRTSRTSHPLLLVMGIVCCAVLFLTLRTAAVYVCRYLPLPVPVVVAVLLLLMSAVALSYAMPKGRVRSFLHALGEFCIGPFAALVLVAVPLGLLVLLFPSLPGKAVGDAGFFFYLALLAFGAVRAGRLPVRRYAVLPSCFTGKSAVLLSDLHLGAFTGKNLTRRLASKIRALSPDLILIAGDLFDDRFCDLRSKDEMLEGLKSLCSVAPVYACFGNHDAFDPCKERDDFLLSSGLRILEDETVSCFGILLTGRKSEAAEQRKTPEELFQDSGFRIVLDHSPSELDELWAAGAELVLSGHTHGGQTFPLTILYGLLGLPVYGHLEKSGRHAVITSGAGAYGFPFRLGVSNELVLLTKEAQ